MTKEILDVFNRLTAPEQAEMFRRVDQVTLEALRDSGIPEYDAHVLSERLRLSREAYADTSIDDREARRRRAEVGDAVVAELDRLGDEQRRLMNEATAVVIVGYFRELGLM